VELGSDHGRNLAAGPVGPYTIQAAIAAVHAQAPIAAATDWSHIVALYGLLLQAHPSPVVELNRAVAVAMRDDPEAGLTLIDAILARGDLCRRLGRTIEAHASYYRALSLTQQEPERRFREKRLSELPE